MYAKTTQNSLHIQISSIACQDINTNRNARSWRKSQRTFLQQDNRHPRARRRVWCPRELTTEHLIEASLWLDWPLRSTLGLQPMSSLSTQKKYSSDFVRFGQKLRFLWRDYRSWTYTKWAIYGWKSWHLVSSWTLRLSFIPKIFSPLGCKLDFLQSFKGEHIWNLE